MVTIKDYGQYETAWCPGCGNFNLLDAVKEALAGQGLKPHQVLFVSGIGQAAKAPHYLNANLFNGLHGRALPTATGAKLANPGLVVIAESGDGCMYSEGGNHFLAAIRRNISLTVLVHNNQVYGLTKGQASPTSDKGVITPAQPGGVISDPVNPVKLAVAMHAGLVARSFAGNREHLVSTITKAMKHKGFSLVDILQPCVTFNHINTFKWYRERCRELPPEYDPSDWSAAMQKSEEWGDNIPVGIIYQKNRPSFEEHFKCLKKGFLGSTEPDRATLTEIMNGYR
ncbi:MAG: 2-oxoacid:ferredoxin oxidoreductase subunit beta [Deltaproteobacteria bacterium]|nr:2-oxoacid:ferredoxin oxidoreductase subunit beta [Deltaproteobacteria bacterium]